MEYITLRGEGQADFVERKSQFIGHAAPVHTEEEALAFIERIRKEHKDAAHNVPAYLLRNGLKRCSDDGEPQGTGGVPVLEVLEKSGVVDAVLVVTRYYGGILLGARGLVRAYSHGAKIGMDAAGLRRMTACKRLQLTLDYSFYGKITYLLPQFDVKTLDSRFEDKVELELLIRAEGYEPFSAALQELTAGVYLPQVQEELFSPIEEM